MKRYFSALLALFFFSAVFCTADSFSEGEKYFKMNNPREAVNHFRNALLDPSVNPSVYNFLGLSYFQTGRMQESLDTFLAGTLVSGTNKRVLYFNAGNTAFAMSLFEKSENYYSLAAAADSQYADAFLNRANARLKQDKLTDAAADYEKYLSLAPNSPQAEKIRSVISLIGGELTAREQEKIRLAQEAERIKAAEERAAAEAAEKKAEEERVAAEKAAAEAERVKAEAERRRKLLEDVAASLKAAESENVSAGIEGVMEYSYESVLD